MYDPFLLTAGIRRRRSLNAGGASGVDRLLALFPAALPDLALDTPPAGASEALGLSTALRGALIVENNQVSLRGFVALHDMPGEEQALVQGRQGVESG